MYYTYGPMQGQDPLGKVDGWYYDENGVMTTKQVANGTYADFTTYARQYIRSSDYMGKPSLASAYARELAGLDSDIGTEYTITDAVNGGTVVGLKKDEYSHDNADGHWRLVSIEAVESYLTTVSLPSVYLGEKDVQRVTDLQTVLNEHIRAESAKFITGIRPVSEIDKFFEELKTMGIEDLAEIYKEAYAVFMESTFK